MKTNRNKPNVHFSVIKTLLITFTVLLWFTQPSFAQDDAQAKEKTEQTETAKESSDKSADEGAAEMIGDPAIGKELFNTNCAACHKRYSRSTGPALHGITDQVSREWIYDWVHNSTAMIEAGDARAVEIYNEFNQTPMTHFPQLSEEDIDNILAYVEQPKPEPKVAATGATSGKANASGGGGISPNLVLGLLAFVLLILVVILVLVNKTLTRFAKEKGIEIHEEKKPKYKPLWKMIAENQFIMIAGSIVIALVASYWVYFYLMQIGVDQGYQPVQPIHFSHRIHAGDNKIECKYCHHTARVSRVSGVPSLNVCMNCHMAISEVAPETATEEYSKEYYDKQIAKLYDAVGWDPEMHQYTGETHPVKWVQIHNLPDFAYFNHSQHVVVGQIKCQKCHGEVQKMEVVKQHAKLTMGWCINCHRTTNVKMEGNKYYEKIHEQLSKKYGIEELTEAQMGGLECGRCHY